MNVRQLIMALRDFDPDMQVVVDGYEGGFDNVPGLVLIKVELDVNVEAENPENKEDWWRGRHEESENGTPVVLIRRGN